MDSFTPHQHSEAHHPQERVRIRFSGASPAQVPGLATTVEEEYRAEIEECRAKIEEYRAKIEELTACLREVGSVRNGVATINATLPPEVLMHIFRCVEPGRPEHIRVAHICRLWRSLLRNTPEFWVKLLDPNVSGAITTYDECHEAVLSDMVRSSSPLGFGIGLDAVLLAAVGEGRIVEDVSRLSSLCLSVRNGNTLASFSGLSFTALDALSIWCLDRREHRSLIPSISSSQFPRLRALETNCALIARRFMRPRIRQLSIGTSVSRVCTTGNPIEHRKFIQTCCRMNGVEDMSSIMQGCGTLEALRFSSSLPDAQHVELAMGAIAFMPQLRALTIVDNQAPRVHAFLERISIPSTTRVRYKLKGKGQQLTGPLLPSDVSSLPMLPSIDEAELRIGSYGCKADDKVQVCFVRGLDKGVEKLCISTPLHKGQVRIVPKMVPSLATVFQSSAITALRLYCFGSPSHLSEDNMVWIMNTFRQLRDLKVHAWRMSFLAGLDRVDLDNLLRLRRLELGSRLAKAGELEAVVCTLASCATRGMCLDVFSYLYLNNGRRSTFEERFGVDDAALSEYRQRLRAVAGSVTLSANKAKPPSVMRNL